MAYIGDWMDVILVVFVAAVLVTDKYSLFSFSAATELGMLLGIVAWEGALINTSVDVVDAKMAYRWWGKALPATWAAIAVLLAGCHILGISFLSKCSWECYISSAVVILWGSAAFFLKSLFPEGDETKQ